MPISGQSFFYSNAALGTSAVRLDMMTRVLDASMNSRVAPKLYDRVWIRNGHATNQIYVARQRTVSSTDYDWQVPPGYEIEFLLNDVAWLSVIASGASTPISVYSGGPTSLAAVHVDLAALLTGISLAAGTAAIGKVGHDTTSIGHGVKTVTAAATAEALAASTACKWVTVQAQTDNTGVVAVGASGVLATVATGTGVALAAGESITILTDNLADIFVDATVNGDGVRYTYGI